MATGDDDLPSVRVEVEAGGTAPLEAPEVVAAEGSSPKLVGALVVAVLIALGAVMLLISPDSEDRAALNDLEDTDANGMDALDFVANGPDVHFDIADSLEVGVGIEVALSERLDVALAVVQPFVGGFVGLEHRPAEGQTAVPGLWFSGDGLDWTQLETVLPADESLRADAYSWTILESNGPLLVLGGQVGRQMHWFTSSDALVWERLPFTPSPTLVLDRPAATTEDSVLFFATNPVASAPPACTNTGPEFFVVEVGLDGSEPDIRFDQDFLISQRLDGSFPAGAVESSFVAIDVGASFGEAQPCEAAVTAERLESVLRVGDNSTGEVASWPLHDKLGFDQTAAFAGVVSISGREHFAFADAGSLSLIDVTTGEWSVVTSPAFARLDLRERGRLSTSGKRLFLIDQDELITVDLVGFAGSIRRVETTTRLTLTEALVGSLENATIVWATDDRLIVSSGRDSWIVEAPAIPDAACTPEYAADGGGVGVARQSCSDDPVIPEWSTAALALEAVPLDAVAGATLVDGDLMVLVVRTEPTGRLAPWIFRSPNGRGWSDVGAQVFVDGSPNTTEYTWSGLTRSAPGLSITAIDSNGSRTSFVSDDGTMWERLSVEGLSGGARSLPQPLAVADEYVVALSLSNSPELAQFVEGHTLATDVADVCFIASQSVIGCDGVSEWPITPATIDSTAGVEAVFSCLNLLSVIGPDISLVRVGRQNSESDVPNFRVYPAASLPRALDDGRIAGIDGLNFFADMGACDGLASIDEVSPEAFYVFDPVAGTHERAELHPEMSPASSELFGEISVGGSDLFLFRSGARLWALNFETREWFGLNYAATGEQYVLSDSGQRLYSFEGSELHVLDLVGSGGTDIEVIDTTVHVPATSGAFTSNIGEATDERIIFQTQGLTWMLDIPTEVRCIDQYADALAGNGLVDDC